MTYNCQLSRVINWTAGGAFGRVSSSSLAVERLFQTVLSKDWPELLACLPDTTVRSLWASQMTRSFFHERTRSVSEPQPPFPLKAFASSFSTTASIPEASMSVTLDWSSYIHSS